MRLGSKALVVSLVAVLSLAGGGIMAAPAAANPFGVLFGGCSTELAMVGHELGIASVRGRVFVKGWSEGEDNCAPFRRSGFDLILTARYDGGHGEPTSVVKDKRAYRSKLRRIIDSLRPALVVVENEQNADVFYSGTRKQYLDTLRAACKAAHRGGTLCADGGLASGMIVAMVYQDFKDKGQHAAADSYARRATSNEKEYQRFVASGNRQHVERIAEKGERFVKNYAEAGADFVNFHWYGTDAKAFSQSVRFLKRKSKLPAISNEIGQYDDDPVTITGIMEKVLKREMQHALWFSFDYTVPANGYMIWALQDEDGQLRRHGEAFASITEGL